MSARLLILDRDGVLCQRRNGYLETPEHWQPLPGALEAVARLNHAGYTVVLAANMPGLQRGLFDMATLNAIHARMHQDLARVGGRIEAIFFCPHTPEDGCDCRKPRPGLFQQIGQRYQLDLRQVHAVGDSASDALAAATAGCQPHMVRTGRAPRPTDPPPPPGTQTHDDLNAFVTAFLAQANAQDTARDTTTAAPAPRP